MSSQSENNKRIAKNTLMLYVRMLFNMVVSLYTSRVILKCWDQKTMASTIEVYLVNKAEI